MEAARTEKQKTKAHGRGRKDNGRKGSQGRGRELLKHQAAAAGSSKPGDDRSAAQAQAAGIHTTTTQKKKSPAHPKEKEINKEKVTTDRRRGPGTGPGQRHQARNNGPEQRPGCSSPEATAQARRRTHNADEAGKVRAPLSLPPRPGPRSRRQGPARDAVTDNIRYDKLATTAAAVT